MQCHCATADSLSLPPGPAPPLLDPCAWIRISSHSRTTSPSRWVSQSSQELPQSLRAAPGQSSEPVLARLRRGALRPHSELRASGSPAWQKRSSGSLGGGGGGGLGPRMFGVCRCLGFVGNPGSLSIKAACQHWAGSRICFRASGSTQADVEIAKVHGTDSASGISQRISTFRTSTSKPQTCRRLTLDMPVERQSTVDGQGA